MFSSDQYQLLDFGEGRRLEQFASRVVDRSCTAAEGIPQADPEAWSQSDGRFNRGAEAEGRWTFSQGPPTPWILRHGPFAFELQATPAGQLGVFPEQAENWDWIAEEVRKASWPLQVLNLFAYTGGSTMAAAAAGAKVVHVDAARNIVAWARRNAELSGLSTSSIRWISEDATKFVRRELKRGNGYDAVILDPPSYGHGPAGEVWKLVQDLPELVELCARLMAGRGRFMLLSCHTLGIDRADLEQLFDTPVLGKGTARAESLQIHSRDGRRLPAGMAVCWTANHA